LRLCVSWLSGNNIRDLSEEVIINAIKQVKHLVAVERRRSSWRRTQAAVRSCCGRTLLNAADSEDDVLSMRSSNSLVKADGVAAAADEVDVEGLARFVDDDEDCDDEILARRL